MPNYLAAVMSNETMVTIFIGLFLGLVLLFVGFLLFQSNADKRARETMKKDLAETQNQLFTNAADMLAKKLLLYTDRILVEKVNANYEKLVSVDLLPAVNDAAAKITELAQAVTTRQEEGMANLAEALTNQLAAKTRDYIRQEAIIITSLQETTGQFSKELGQVTANTQVLAASLYGTCQQASSTSVATAEAASALFDKISALTTALDGTMQAISLSQANILDNCSAAKSLGDTTLEMQKLTAESSAGLTAQNEKIAVLLSDTIQAMQHNTEEATKGVLTEFTANLGIATNSISATIDSLQAIADGIKLSAAEFARSLSNSYNTVGSSLDEKMISVTDKVSQAIAAEYDKILKSTESYSLNFSQGVSQLDSSLETHISNLQTITQQLNNNVNSFKGDVDTSSSRFELGMEKSVAEALAQMDSSLAEIVKRLVAVTANIQEAADALPKAANALK